MRLKELYQKEILPRLKEEFGLKNDFLAPKLDKVVINVGFGRHNKDKAYIESVGKSLTSISGQKPIFTKAKKSISAFKIREGMTIGGIGGSQETQPLRTRQTAIMNIKVIVFIFHFHTEHIASSIIALAV